MSSELAQLPASVADPIVSAVPKIEGDLFNYITDLVGGTSFISAFSKLDPFLPDDVKTQAEGDPAGFAFGLVTAATPPAWADAIPTDVAGYLQSVGEDVDSIISKDVTIPPLPLPTPATRTTLESRPGGYLSGIPITRQTVLATSTASTVGPASIVTTAPAGSGVLPSGSIGSGGSSGSGTNRIVTTPSSPTVSQFVPGSAAASRWNSMIGTVAALMAVGVGALLLA